MNPGSTTLVLLSYNEREALEKLISLIPFTLFDRVFAIDAGSTDGTLDLYQAHAIPYVVQAVPGRGNAFLQAQELVETERLCFHYREDYGLETRIVRFHNIFGPLGTWEGGREKAPAALCRKIAIAKLTANPGLEIWGDGEQTRPFCYISDCVNGLYKLMRSDYQEPLNLGQDRLVTINQLADMIAEVAGICIRKKYIVGPQGVRGRNSDNTQLRQTLSWEPEVSLEQGLAYTYAWVENQVQERLERTRKAEII